jgi:hypothetical protein
MVSIIFINKVVFVICGIHCVAGTDDLRQFRGDKIQLLVAVLHKH